RRQALPGSSPSLAAAGEAVSRFGLGVRGPWSHVGAGILGRTDLGGGIRSHALAALGPRGTIGHESGWCPDELGPVTRSRTGTRWTGRARAPGVGASALPPGPG